ncbi:MAG: DinB family protein [Chloroflexota bacterium]
MNKEQQPLSKTELIKTIKAERARLEDIVSTLTDDQMTQTDAKDDWSIKDILAHIAAWEDLAVDRLTAAITGTSTTNPLIQNWDDVHAFNAACYQENKSKTLTEVLKNFQNTYQRFLSIVNTLDDNFIAEALPFDWADGMTAFELIAANSYWHYQEHREVLEKWLNNS